LDALIREPWFDHRGAVDQSQSMRLLSSADVVCLPSTYASECQPLALIEAMCAARPLVVANTPALRATVKDYPCEMVDVVNPESVRACLQRIARSRPPAALSAAAVAARERFSAGRFDRQLALILRIPADLSPA
jgi:glycosyltransferase involved in cell wall biosynthesis